MEHGFLSNFIHLKGIVDFVRLSEENKVYDLVYCVWDYEKECLAKRFVFVMPIKAPEDKCCKRYHADC